MSATLFLSGLSLALASISLCVGGHSLARAGGFAPPLKFDVGSAVVFHEGQEVRTGTAFAIGLNWATVYPKPTNFDLGIGYLGTIITPPHAEMKPAAKSARPSVHDASLASMHGGFIELLALTAERRHARVWLGGRAELLRSSGDTVFGVATRLSAEVWTGLAHSTGSGAAYGVGALGLWTEIGVRQLPGYGLLRQASVGLSIRLPMVASGI